MISTLLPVIIIGVVIVGTYHLSGLYGIAIAAVGLLSTLGITLAADTYGPVADNAAGIAEMAKLGKDVRRRCESHSRELSDVLNVDARTMAVYCQWRKTH